MAESAAHRVPGSAVTGDGNGDGDGSLRRFGGVDAMGQWPTTQDENGVGARDARVNPCKDARRIGDRSEVDNTAAAADPVE
jgi:hypothetical protein